MKKPLLLRCHYCLQWTSFPTHRLARKQFVHLGRRDVEQAFRAAVAVGEDWFGVIPERGVWVHVYCQDDFLREGPVWDSRERKQRSSEKLVNELFGHPAHLSMYRGTLVRYLESLDVGGYLGAFLDEGEAAISADKSNADLIALLDQMSEEECDQLVGAGATTTLWGGDTHARLGWLSPIPSRFIGEGSSELMSRARIDGVECHSFVVAELPKELRIKLSSSKAERL